MKMLCSFCNHAAVAMLTRLCATHLGGDYHELAVALCRKHVSKLPQAAGTVYLEELG